MSLSVVIITTGNGMYPTFSGMHPTLFNNFRSLPTFHGVCLSLEARNAVPVRLRHRDDNEKCNKCLKNSYRVTVVISYFIKLNKTVNLLKKKK